LIKDSLSNRLVLLFLSLVFCLLLAEVGLRVILAGRLEVQKDERNLTYRYDSFLGWFPVEDSVKEYEGSRTINVRHNSRGFRDEEHLVGENPRILFLGDSFVWGYDVNESERFTEKLETLLPDWSVYNLGVSGYGTDQEYLLLKEHYDYYRPNVVLLVFCSDNDFYDNTRNNVYGGYYKPYFAFNGEAFELGGIPVPRSENFFFANHYILAKSYLARLVSTIYFRLTTPPHLEVSNPTYAIINKIYELSKDKGFRFIIGLQEETPELEPFLSSNNIPYLLLSNPYRYPSHGRHWTPAGHAYVAEKIYEYLKQAKLVNDGMHSSGITRPSMDRGPGARK